MSQPLRSLTLALTAYNEESGLARTAEKALAFLPKAAKQWNLFIVDDGSRDRTAEVARELASKNPNVRVLTHDRNRGMGAAIRTAIENCSTEWFCTIAADGQVDPADLMAFVEPANRGQAVFSTYSVRRDGLDRNFLSLGLRCLIFLKTGVWKIPTGNYFVPTETLRTLSLRSDSFFVNFEVFLGISAKRLPTAWAQIPCAPRERGASKVRNLRTIAKVASELFRYTRP